jgi:hypothetical protein
MQCRSVTKVFEWATTPEQGMLQAGNYFPFVLHNLEKHTFCSMDTPYYDIAKEYFETHGHKTVYVGGLETAGFGNRKAWGD